jgi:5-methylcytosine-specific restriction endonuclease McrA
MIRRETLASISNDDLFVTVQRLTARSNVALADLLAHLGEVERRGIHRLRAAPARRGSRHIPAAVRRAVFGRDGERCAYRDDRGQRCRETRGLEIHHRRAHALGGPATLDNVELRCRSHNALAAEDDFGREHIDFARGVALDMQYGSPSPA